MQASPLQLAPSPGLMARVAVWVLALHGLALWLWLVGIKPSPVAKRPDITIEFYAPPAVQAVAAQEEQSAPAPSVKPTLQQPPTRQTPKPLPKTAEHAAPIEAVAPVVEQAQPSPVAPPANTSSTSASVAQAAAQAVMQTAATVDADYKAAYLNNPKPPYPAAAVRRGAEGRVVLLAEVLADGRAGRVQLEQSSGHAMLDAAAMNTVRVWRFTPARKDGVIVTQTVRIPIEFNLKEAR